ncbi:hypothetical protein CONLIGDRAFT_684049 [Coniochaeta ligniaria NRRL 30616]|uniref:Uncharacterized protein n=1 Tax=Coniochaeta ligniaria NRRL 30616 TaxID=1408157 RepID=A0A1J7JBG8_9PEZI|nr:hypothetical protein CONLIGDRAFT_684049 [Coniochaeta ligniaria NRRL 30616]
MPSRLCSSATTDGEVDLLVFASPYAFRGYWRFDAYVNIPADLPGTFGLSMVKMYPQNRAGVVKLRSINPREVPAIKFKYVEENWRNDLEAVSDAVLRGRRGLQHCLSTVWTHSSD